MHWTQHKHIVDCDLTSSDLSTRGSEYAYIRLALIVKRKHMHYIQTMYSMIFFLTACGFSVFTLQVEQMGERVATNFTLLLTMVSYKFAMNDILPRLEYFTFIDQYIYLAFGMVILIVFESVCIQKAWSSRETEEEKQVVLDYDTYVTILFVFSHNLFYTHTHTDTLHTCGSFYG